MTVNAKEVSALRERLNVTQALLADAIGLSEKDGGRVVRAWEKGMRNGKPYNPSGTAIKAMEFLEAIHKAKDCLADGDQLEASRILVAVLPEEMR